MPRPKTDREEKKGTSESILNSIRRIVRALRESSRAVEKDLEISGAQLFVLQKLGDEKVLSINELAARTLTHQSSVSAVVSRLIDQGWVQQSKSEQDRRKSDIALTAMGRKLLSRAPRTVQERLMDGIGHLSKGERKALARLLEKVLLYAELADQPATLFFEEDVRSKKGVGKK